MAPKESPQDIVQVYNSDITCTLNDPEHHPQGQQFFTIYFREGINNDKVSHTVEAGKTKLFPRYLAEYFSKKLADHLLTAQDIPVTHKQKREEVLKGINLGVVEYFAPQSPETIAAQVEKLNTERVEDGGIAPPTTGYVQDVEVDVQLQPENPVEATTETSEPKETPSVKPNPTRAELFEECKTLGVAVTGKETVAELQSKIKQFAGV